MNSLAFASSSAPSPTIRDLEQRCDSALQRLAATSDSTPANEATALLSELRELFAPANVRPAVQLEEDGRKKRSTAAASNWKFETGAIVIYFEPATLEASTTGSSITSASAGSVLPMPANSNGVSKLEVQQCCEALAEAENAGRQFIALKWFRDLALTGLPHVWAQTVEGRHRVLTSALESGAIQTKKIPNPKSPMHPTTTVVLNRASSLVTIPSRFSPISVKGEPVSMTLLRDRGSV